MRRLEGSVRVNRHTRIDACSVYIPRQIARRLGLEKGHFLDIRLEGDEIVISKAEKSRWRFYSSGYVTLPKRIRQELGIEGGEELLLFVDYEAKRIYLRKAIP